jgi:LysM repeat protein
MSIYAKRRLTVLVLLAGAFLAGGKALDALGGGPLTAAEDRSSVPVVPVVRLVTEPVSKATYVVQSGDTLWSIARSIKPAGDVRPIVDRLAAGRHGKPLQPGDRIVLP